MFRQRVAAYALAVDEKDRVLLVLSGPRNENMWFLPGGEVEFGEHPAQGVRREVMEETGQVVESLTLDDVLSDTSHADGCDLHSVRIVYRARISSDTELRPETGGSTVGARWVPLIGTLDLKLAPFVRRCLQPLYTGRM